MQTTYPLNVQAIRSQGKQPRLYVTFPLALAAAIGTVCTRTRGVETRMRVLHSVDEKEK